MRKFQFSMPSGLPRNAWNESSKQSPEQVPGSYISVGRQAIQWSQLRLWNNVLKPQFSHLQNRVNNSICTLKLLWEFMGAIYAECLALSMGSASVKRHGNGIYNMYKRIEEHSTPLWSAIARLVTNLAGRFPKLNWWQQVHLHHHHKPFEMGGVSQVN